MMSKSKLFIVWAAVFGAFLLWPKGVQADIVLRTMVVNPSQTRTQEATLKAYLPYEAGPDDIIDKGDLSLDYDIEQNMYYVYKVVELGPGEKAEEKIRLRDIWIISQSQLEGLSARARELVESLKQSAHFQTVLKLQEDIDQKQEEIIRRQSSIANDMPQARIGAYRTNKESLEAIRANIGEMERLYLEHKVSDVGTAGDISVDRSWMVIWIVITALGLLSLVFFIIWHKQAGVLKTETEDDPDQE